MGKSHGLRLKGFAPAAVLLSFNCFLVCLNGGFQKAGWLTSNALHCGHCCLLQAANKKATDNWGLPFSAAAAGSHQAQAHAAFHAAACLSNMLHSVEHLDLMATGCLHTSP